MSTLHLGNDVYAKVRPKPAAITEGSWPELAMDVFWPELVTDVLS